MKFTFKEMLSQKSSTVAELQSHRRRHKERLQRWMMLVFLLTLLVVSTGGSTVSQTNLRLWGMALVVDEWIFNLAAWEIDALWQKFRAAVLRPASGLDYMQSTQLVHDYLNRAERIRQIEQEINELLSRIDNLDISTSQEPPTTDVQASDTQATVAQRQQELVSLRDIQQTVRSTVEQVIEAQIAYELHAEGMTLLQQTFPPVQFAFVEPPRKLVVSPRDRITIDFSRMLDATMEVTEIEAVEEAYYREFGSSAYITNIGGLGAFPTMVVDQASLEWILSTVAHEWVHNYLTLYPLGINYATNADFVTMNETVAEIVGNEVGKRALHTFYPKVPLSPKNSEESNERLLASDHPLPFDFRAAMRETRLTVDQLLALGKIEDAERYMEARRIYFVENGYPLRVLNQAYFAFHGSYGTSAASTSPVGPKMEALRAQSPTLKAFLETVRSFTSVNDLDVALANGN